MKLNKTRSIATILVIATLASLTACGGSGGSENASMPVSVAPPVAIVTPPVAEVPVASTPAPVTPVEIPPVVTPVTPPVAVVTPPVEVVVISDKSESANTVVHTITDSQVRANIKTSNIDYNANLKTWRWNNASVPRVVVYVPNPTTSQEQGYADKVNAAIKVTNYKLNGSLVLETTNVQSSTNNIRVSYNTAYVPKGFTDYKSGSYCGNVSTGPYSGNPIAPDWKNEITMSLVYVNVGNGNCNVTEDLVSHEFGHALGLTNHFEGFGIGPAVSDEYWDTLATLYNNKPSIDLVEVVVTRALKTPKEGGINVPPAIQFYCEKQVRYETSSKATLPATQYASYGC